MARQPTGELAVAGAGVRDSLQVVCCLDPHQVLVVITL